MDKKIKKKTHVLQQRIQALRQQLAGAKKQMDDQGELKSIEQQLAAAEAVFQAEALKAELEAARQSLGLLADDWDTCRSINTNQRAERNAIEGYGS